MTYESICEKLGFDPLKEQPKYNYNGHEDDSQKSPFSVLTLEELDFLEGYLFP